VKASIFAGGDHGEDREESEIDVAVYAALRRILLSDIPP
jgi:hypothetical protein